MAYHFGLKGPAIAIDTACSSSLVATNSARESVWSTGGSAVVGGINMMLAAGTTFMFKKAGMLSADGRCKALDDTADGYVRSEASRRLHACGTKLLACLKRPAWQCGCSS